MVQTPAVSTVAANQVQIANTMVAEMQLLVTPNPQCG